MEIALNKKTVGLVIGAKVIAVLLGSVFMAVPALAQSASAANDMTTLEVSSIVEAKATPDQAQITAGVMNIAPTAEQALKDNATKMTTMFAALKKIGIAEKDIQTTGVNINTQYVYEENKSPRVTGYQALNNVSVMLHDMKSIGATLDTLVKEGANQLSGPMFSVENPDVILDKARAEAVAKAQKRADLYAQATGLKVKRIISLSEAVNDNGPRPYPVMAKRMEMAADSASSPVATGEVGLSITVNVTYELAQ